MKGLASLLALVLAGGPLLACSSSRVPRLADPPVEVAEELVLGTEVRRDLLVELGRDARFIDVDADTRTDGKVILSGAVRSDTIRDLAIDIASQSATEVENRLSVDPVAAPEPTAASEAIAEADLEVAVMLALLEGMGPDAAEIAVEVDDYEVTLLGEVDAPADEEQALEIARQQDGVAIVHDDLSVILRAD